MLQTVFHAKHPPLCSPTAGFGPLNTQLNPRPIAPPSKFRVAIANTYPAYDSDAVAISLLSTHLGSLKLPYPPGSAQPVGLVQLLLNHCSDLGADEHTAIPDWRFLAMMCSQHPTLPS